MIESGVVENDVCAFERTALREMQTLPRQRRLARSVDAVDRDARRMTGPQPGDRGGKLLDDARPGGGGTHYLRRSALGTEAGLDIHVGGVDQVAEGGGVRLAARLQFHVPHAFAAALQQASGVLE